MTAQMPPFGGPAVAGPWGPPPTHTPIAAWSPSAARIIVAHGVLWVGFLVLVATAGPWERVIVNALLNRDGFVGRAAYSSAFASIYGILTLPVAVALVLAGRSAGRLAAGLALLLVSIALGVAAAVGDSGNVATTLWIAMAVTFSAAWIIARRRNPAGLFVVPIAAVVAFLIYQAGPSLHMGNDAFGWRSATLAVLPIVVTAWAAVGVDALTAPRGGEPAPPRGMLPGVPPPPVPGYPPTAPQHPSAPPPPWMTG